MSSWFGGTSSVGPERRHSSHSHAQSQSRSRHRGSSPPKYAFVRPSSHSHSHSQSRGRSPSPTPTLRSLTSIFTGAGGGRHSSSYSAYRRRPRDGYISRMVDKIRRLLRRLLDYARRNPMKLFVLVIMPLITGGALGGILKALGLSVPSALQSVVGGGSRRGTDFGSSGGGGGGMDLDGVMNIAKMFI